MSPSEHSPLYNCSTCKPRSRFYLQCRQGADGGCCGSTFVRPASLDACCCETKLVGCFCLTINSLAPHNTAHQVQLFSGARSARNPHPPPFDKHRFTMFWEKAMAPHSSALAWKIPWTEEPGRLQSMGSRRVGHN